MFRNFCVAVSFLFFFFFLLFTYKNPESLTAALIIVTIKNVTEMAAAVDFRSVSQSITTIISASDALF